MITTRRTRRETRRASARGYTAVEVLIAMTLFAIGAAGVIGMQRVTIQGGEDARRFDMATNIANEWIARLQRDSTFWTKPNSSFPDTMNLSETRWLKDVDNGCNAFCTIATTGAGFSGAFDSFGRDITPNVVTNPAIYCVQYRLNWIAAPGIGPTYPKPLKMTGLMRAEVRVYWNRLEAAPVGLCTTPPADNEATLTNSTYHMVYATTSIREVPSR